MIFLIKRLITLFETRTKSFYDLYEEKIKSYKLQLKKTEGKKVIDTLDNSLTRTAEIRYDNKIFNLSNSIEKTKSFIGFNKYIKNEIKKINTITNNIPDDILPLLSKYKTFYYGNTILYLDNELNDDILLQCIINHILHYTLMAYKKQRFAKNALLRAFAAMGFLPNKSMYDYNEYIIKYFDKIYRDEVKDIICFEPQKEFFDFIKNKIENNDFCKSTKYFIAKDKVSYCFLNKHIKANQIDDSMDCNTQLIKSTNNSTKIIDRDHKKNIIGEYRETNSYFKLDKEVVDLLISNNIQYFPYKKSNKW